MPALQMCTSSATLPGGANEVYFATVKVSDHDLDKASGLDRLGAFRLNIGVGRDTFVSLFGSRWSQDFPRSGADDLNYGEVNVLMPHPVYAGANWVCIVNPSKATFDELVVPLLDEAYRRAVRQFQNKRAPS